MLKSKKANGFATVVGFLFTFFILVTVYVGVFTIFQDQIIQQVDIAERTQDDSYLSSLESTFEISSPFYYSGRLNLVLNNTGSSKLYFKEGDNLCFNIIYNDRFINNSDYEINILSNPSGNYKFIEEGSYGILSFKTSFDSSRNNSVKVVSCSGDDEEYLIEQYEIDWFDFAWQSRENMTITNPSDDSIVEYQIELSFNNSNFDFDSVDKDDLRFVLPYKEQLFLDLTFDDLTQSLEDFSKFGNDVTLGLNTGSESQDPSSSEGVFFDGVVFDGTGDLITVNGGNSLVLDKEFTLSTWLKWDNSGDALQTIFHNDDTNSQFRIINDGGARDLNLEFLLNSSNSLFNVTSNQTLDTNWNFVSVTYNGEFIKMYLNGELVSQRERNGLMNLSIDNSHIGYNGTGNFYSGILDEFKIFNIALSKEELEDLYNNNLRYKHLNFYVATWDEVDDKSKIFVKLPYVGSTQNVSVQMYYQNPIGPRSFSDIEDTFSYSIPRTVGYVVSERVDNNIGLTIVSLYDDNKIQVDDNEFNLSKYATDTIGSGNVEVGNEVRMKYLAQVEGNGAGADMIVPISWAGREFHVNGHRNNPDTTCIYSPFADASIDILESGTGMTSFSVNENSDTCHANNTGTTNVYTLESDVPVLLMYYGDTADDVVPMLPTKYNKLYGVPTGTRFLASGPQGADAIIKESDSSLSSISLGNYGGDSSGGQGTQGEATAQLYEANNPINVWQQGDGDGGDSTTFGSEEEMGVLFGSSESIEYIVIASPNANANCSTFTSSGIVDTNTSGEGGNGIFKYSFNTGGSAYISQPWSLSCDKPVWPMYEKGSDDETNAFGHLQMRQYTFPEPIIVLS